MQASASLPGSSYKVVSNLRTGPKRTGPDQLPKIRTEGPDHYINCCRHVCNAYGYAPSNQIPIFFPNYHVVTVTACISIDSISVLKLHGEKTIAGCRNIGLYSYVMCEVWIYAIQGLSCTK